MTAKIETIPLNIYITDIVFNFERIGNTMNIQSNNNFVLTVLLVLYN